MNLVTMFYIVWTVTVVAWGAVQAMKYRDEVASLEDYAARLEDWELDYKVRFTALTGLLMYARRLSGKTGEDGELLYPLLEMNMAVLESEIFSKDEEGVDES